MQACTLDGTVYDIVNIVNYVQKFHRHPVTGQPLALKDIVTLTFHKNADGEYHCPVLHKVFTESTHIVAIRTTGHVYCYEVWSCVGPTTRCMGSKLWRREAPQAPVIHSLVPCAKRSISRGVLPANI